jgi:hypothetical protein
MVNYLDLFVTGHNRVPNNVQEFDQFITNQTNKSYGTAKTATNASAKASNGRH